MTEVQVINPAPINPASPQTGDLVEFGTILRSMGLNAMDARAVIDELHSVAHGVALAAAPKVLSRVQAAQQDRMMRLMTQIQTLPVMMGYVSRDSVLRIIASIMNEMPRT